MRIPTEITPKTYERIAKLVENGDYSSAQQFITVSIRNQLKLEFSDTEDIPSQKSIGQNYQKAGFEWKYSVPEIKVMREAFPIDRTDQLLFSQYSRFLPLKFVLYELAKKTSTIDEPVELNQFREYIEEMVVPLRDAIVAWEKKEEVKKQKKKSTGFPKADSKHPERSMNRFLNHFVGHVQRTKGEPAGFGHELGLVSLRNDDSNSNSWTISLTPSGAAFLENENPLLEHGPTEPPLSGDEKRFLVSYTKEYLDLEFEFMRYIADILSEINGSYNHGHKY
jgi:Arc/MetJ-type ribon-helix-helix transcriptional regulator